MILFGRYFRGITIEDILNFVPGSLPLAALVFMGIYAVKSVTVVFPLLVIYVSVGMIFPPFWAVAVNLCGLAVTVSIPYWIGRVSGSGAVERLVSRYRRAEQLSRFGARSGLFLSYLLRIINLLPGDLVSMYLGALACLLSGLFSGLGAGPHTGDDPRHPVGRIDREAVFTAVYPLFGGHPVAVAPLDPALSEEVWKEKNNRKQFSRGKPFGSPRLMFTFGCWRDS